ncbi:MAG: MATE family efflux transporter, partial [Oscillospiraceae bacterium]
MNTMTAQTNPLGTEKIHKLILKYSVPCVISMLVNSIYNIVDQIFIGQKIGYLGTGATNVAFPLVTLSMAIALLIGDGQAANFSLKLGRNKKEDAEKSLGNAVTLAIICGLAFLIFGLAFLTPLLKLFGTTDAIMPLAQSYTSITIIGLPFVIFGTMMNSTIRADGSPQYAMYTMLIGAVINIVLDPIFLFVLDFGIEGAAIATIIGQFVTFLFAVRYLKHLKHIKFKKE